MATYYLEIDDEITSAAARIRNSPDEAVALVLPAASRVATSRINFKLLAREAKGQKKRLTIVAAEPGVRSLARSAELPVFATVAEYEAAEAARLKAGPAGEAEAVSTALVQLAASMDGGGGATRKGPGGDGRSRADTGPGGGAGARGRRIGLSGAVLAGLAAVMIAGAGGAAFLFLPSTAITLTVRQEPVGPLDLTIKVDPAIVTPDDSVPAVPGLSKEFNLRQSDKFQATGEKVVDTKATGTVTFTSTNTYLAVPVIAGTEVSTAGGVVFTTTATVTVPKAKVAGSKITPGTADGPIAAKAAGTNGNVAAGAIVKVPPDLAAVLVSPRPVINSGPTSGGTHTVNPLITQSDVDNARTVLSARLAFEFAGRLAAPDVAPPGVQLFKETADPGLASMVLDPDPLTLVNRQADSFDLTASAKGTVMMADLAVFRSVAERKIAASIKPGYGLVAGSLTIDVVSSSVAGSAVNTVVVASAMEAPTVDVDKLRQAVKGKSVGEARRYLSQYGSVEIKSWPGLWTSDVAGFDFRIDMRVLRPTAPAGASPSAAPSPSPLPSNGAT